MNKYDLIIIGSGPGGYVGAIRAAQLGQKVAIIEKYPTLGGTCLNVGCIPSKALLDSSEHYHNADKSFETHGIKISNLGVDLKQMVKRKQDVVDQTCKGVEFLMKKNKIEVFTGVGSFKSAKVITVTANDGSTQEIEGTNIIIATGSKPVTPESFNYDKNRVITSTEALNIEKLPKKMVVIGAGVIGLELGSVFARLGTQVDVVEYMDSIIGGMDVDCGKELRRSLKKLGINFHLKHMVTGVKGTKTAVTVSVQKRDSEEKFDLKADYCLIAIGRKPYTEGLGLENTKVELDEKGRVKVDEHLQTGEPGVYAIGDVIPGAMLAHKAEEEGVFLAELLAGQKPHIDYNLIPGVVYTWPEVAAVGATEEMLKEKGVAYKVGKFPFKALGRARASMDTEGMVKVLADKETDEILGVHMVGPRCADLIMEAVALMEFRASAEDMARLCHPHPTFTEAVKEAALAATDNRALHV
ncbi:dihydrolipoyl dehydrogenase [Portibacter lacus]|uniref:Dihydrolipoyl dehydrogenase n=1 Tax=Portibacter lacus TaxID=1099794 RepID=A0AA37WD98_9BACT|nr:dihydrolipoyl dehydrogenase [Portibacter lacus]GLR17756.1 dihydrolipoyl dehydrogenase [Portibacter lacus]